ncbi:DUF1127 domain-containing protein [uncultured Roseobacter sp.]|uniref:DUF1127 domain-containing protein n=1 Tax=uncultured Roseobacter sp. TaxID=114847 RepID=UPI002626B56A|nr:DUF1127 domain-containing protein [uncultured Roseobacter sp.]
MSMIETRTTHVTWKSLWPTLRTRLGLWRSRRALARLDARALADIGVSPEEARREASLTVWDVPQSWKK